MTTALTPSRFWSARLIFYRDDLGVVFRELHDEYPFCSSRYHFGSVVHRMVRSVLCLLESHFLIGTSALKFYLAIKRQLLCCLSSNFLLDSPTRPASLSRRFDASHFPTYVAQEARLCKLIPYGIEYFHAISMLAALISIRTTLTSLQTRTRSQTWCPSTSSLYLQYHILYYFRSLLVLYWILPSLIVSIQTTMLTWKEQWVVDLLNNVIILAFYFLVGLTFSPLDVSMLTRAFDGSMVWRGSRSYVRPS
jgi:hypothetical protein